ncbi:hypothetical protein SBD_6497 [Streptomyces bottropensis ATCC 25435]|uniref:Uncharacterized protein n=1 Tax=Streptomyces bottropensis ATCC 25435 TaxID=1054862 RepID=M3FGE9_9ACTN|nr:hypothetical protein SBD_6497 [Streptomyces bottropensis ATCC 25435]
MSHLHVHLGRVLIEFDDDYALAKTVAPDIATGVPLGQSQATSSWSPARPARWRPSPNSADAYGVRQRRPDRRQGAVKSC